VEKKMWEKKMGRRKDAKSDPRQNCALFFPIPLLIAFIFFSHIFFSHILLCVFAPWREISSELR